MRKWRPFFKGLAIILILTLLSSNVVLVPNVYAAYSDSTSSSSLVPETSEKANGRTSTSSLTDQVYGTENSLKPVKQNDTLIGSVYAEKVDKEIEYPSFPKTPLSSNQQGFQHNGVFMKHVVHMPGVDEKPVPFTPRNDRILNEQNLVGNNNGNNPGIPISDNGSDSTSPTVLTINDLKEGIIDENDLNLISTDSVSKHNQSGSSVIDLVYGETNGSFPIRNKAGHYSASFSHRAGSDLLRYSFKTANLTLSPINPAYVSGNVYKNSILYENIYPNTDLRYSVEQFRLKEEMVVKRYTGQSDFFFQLSVENAVYKVMPDSTFLFYDPASGQPLFYMPRGFAVDNNGNRCDSVTLKITEEGLLRLTVDSNWLQNAAYPIVIDPTINLFDATFSRPSVAYKQNGTQVTSGSPRYETAKFNQGIIIEEGTTNLLTANQSSIEMNLSGLAITGGTPAKGVLSRITTDKWTGSACAKVVVTGYVIGDDINFATADTAESSDTAVSPNTKYTASFYFKGTVGTKTSIRLIQWNANGGVLSDSGAVNTTDGDGSWQRLTYTFTTTASTAYVNIRAFLSADGTYIFDGLQLEQKSHATSWIAGGTTRNDESMTIPTSGVLNPDQGTIEEWVYLDPNGVHSANNPSWTMPFSVATVQSSPYAELNQISIRRTPSSTSWSVWFSNSSGALDTVSLGNITTPGWYCFGVKWQQGVGGYGYLNGVLKGSVSASYLPSTVDSTAYIGSWSGINQFNNIIDDLRISLIPRTDSDILAAYQSNQPLTVDSATTCKLSFDGSLHAYPTVNSINTTFTRPSVAYKQDGTQVVAGSPRYESAKFNQGMTIEEGTTNLFYDSSFESGSMSSWTTWNWGGTGSATVTSTASRSGIYGCQISGGDYGCFIALGSKPDQLYYSQSYYVKRQDGLPLQSTDVQAVFNNQRAAFDNITSVGNGWYLCKKENIQKTNSISTWGIYVVPGLGIYVDECQVEQKPYATSWMHNGTTRSFESFSIPTSGVFNPSQGNIEEWVYIDPNGVHSAKNPNWSMPFSVVTIQNSPYAELNQISIRRTPSSTSWSVWFSNSSGALDTVSLGNITTPGWYCIGVKWQQGVGGYGYLNGVLKGSVSASYLPSTFDSTAHIGSWLGSNQFNNVIDDLRISSIARTDSDILAAYQSNQPLPIDSATTCKLSFDSNSSGYTEVQSGPGIEPYWNYTSMGLGGGWQASVNTWNLNLILNKPLFVIPGRGMPIGESITYNSIKGRTWTFGNMTSVIENQDGSVIYNKSDGGTYTFTPNGSGGYTAPSGIYLTLQKNGAGNFTILDKHKNTYNYVNGKPNQFTDRNNNTTTFTYDGNGRLYQVSDPSGRKLTYAYDAGGRVISVTDPANRAYQFAYQNDCLTSVTDPTGKTFTLSYDANGRVASFTDPLNRVTSFFGNPNGQIMRLRDARTNGQDIYETSFTQALEGNSIIAMITDPGNKTSKFYHDNNTGNLTKYQDALGNTWQYVWTNNKVTNKQDAKGQTTYQYDSWGNVTSQTTTVDGNTSNNITKTMTYDDYNQLLTVVDGSGRTTSYKYNNRGNLLSTSNPDVKESNGSKYDQYGNTIEYSPGVLGNHNLLRNGSMEIAGTGGNLLANWTRVSGAATVSLEGFKSHGNSALKISSTTSTTDWFYQSVSGVNAGDKLTLRADVKLDNVQGSNGGAEIRLDYGGGWYEGWYIWGGGTVPILLTSQAASRNVTVYIGFKNATGTAWFDGVQLENAGNSSQGYILGGFSSVENSGFEQNLDYWGSTGVTPTVTNEAVWEGVYSLKVNLSTSGTATAFQDVPVYGGEPLTFSGMVKTNGISGNGAYYKIDYYDSSNNLISGTAVQTGYVTGTQDWTRLSTLATAPANAHHARVQSVLDGSGIAYFDAIKLIPRNSQKYTYDTTGNYVITSEDALGKRNKYTHDQNTGNVLTFTDALNKITSYGYDNLNRLIRVTDPLNKNSYYEYDSVSNNINTRDPRSASATDNTYRTSYGPNNLNQLNTLTDPLNQNVSYTYDRSGNLIQVSLPNGLKQDFIYDGANRLIKTTLDGGKYFTYSYDGANELVGVADQDNKSYSWNYDGAHRLTNSTDTFGYGLNYNWDKSHNLISLSGSDYGNSQYNYGSDNKLLSVTLPDGSSIFYDYDENGRIFNVRYPGSYNYRKINYSSNGWVSKIQDPHFPGSYNYDYYYYDNGTISGYSSWAGSESFSYDANGRLTYWYYSPMGGGSSIQENYSYDAVGNLLTKGNKTYTYNNANQITNTGFTYDVNGNLTCDGKFIYVYNALNQLVQVKKASDNSLVATYTYNHNGLRKSKTVNGVTTNYNWDASGHLIRESSPSGNTYYYYDTSGELVGIKKNNTTYIIHDNLRGDAVSVTDASNNIVAQYHFDPWGNQISYSGTISQPIRYAGYYFDEETGLYYLKSRYYSPVLGRFLTRDGIGFIIHLNPQTLNLYSYCGNNPVSLTDPTGNAPKKLRDLVASAGGKITWNAKTGIATVTVGGKTKTYDIDDCTVVNGRIIIDDAAFNSYFGKSTKKGYGDANVTVISPWLVGGTGGVMTDENGLHPYEGIAVGLPGFSMSGTGSTKYTVTEGWNVEAQGVLFGHSVQVGWSFGNKQQSSGGFVEWGGSAGNSILGLSGSAYYVH